MTNKYNSFIDDYLIDVAKNIRERYIHFSENIEIDSKDLNHKKKLLEEVYNDLANYNFDDENDLLTIRDKIVSKLSNLESVMTDLTSSINNKNDEIESLKEEEIKLYTTLIKKYKNKTSEDISKEINKYLD